MRHKLCGCGAVREDKFGAACPSCGAGKKLNNRNTTQHGYDGAWNRLSKRVRTERPLCERCTKDGIVTPATEVHHIISIDDAPWLRLEVGNLESLCKACHMAAHASMAPGVG